MSRSTLKAVWPGEKTEDLREFRNSWGTGPLVWNELSVRFLGKAPNGYLLGDLQPLWDLWRDERVPEHWRAVHTLCFDRFYVLLRHYKRMAKDIRACMRDLRHWDANAVNHWPAIAELLESVPDCPAIGLHCTSVTSNPFDGPYDEETDTYLPFDWSTAYEVYSEMDGLVDAGDPSELEVDSPDSDESMEASAALLEERKR